MTQQEQRAELDRLIKFFASAKIPKGRVQITKWLSSDDLANTIEVGILRATHNIGGWGIVAFLADLGVIEKYLKENN